MRILYFLQKTELIVMTMISYKIALIYQIVTLLQHCIVIVMRVRLIVLNTPNSGAVRCTTGATPPPPACSSSTTSPTSCPTSGSVTEGLRTVVNTALALLPTSHLILLVGDRKGGDSCSHQLCECDRKFVSCLSRFKCPHSKAMCKSPWRYFQNLFMGLGTGMVNFPSVEK